MKRSPHRFIHNVMIATVMLFFCSAPQAATYINHTRIIIDEKYREATFNIVNEGGGPVLMQLWSDRNNLLDRPEEIKMPFIILPPVFRLDARMVRTVRLQLVNREKNLPSDKESLFWLNALEVPSKSAAQDSDNVLQVAFRTRIKIFYRPASLAKVTLVEGVNNLQSFTVDCGGKTCLRIKSASPLYITLLDVTLNNGKVITDLPEDGMIAPLSFIDIPFDKLSSLDGNIKSLSWIDDYGVMNVSNK